jgi:hypothetical protein
MWLELGKNFGRTWKAFFTRLGELHGLNRRNPYHLWLLHQLFLTEIRADSQEFCEMWNHHPISGKKHGLSPVVCIVAFTFTPLGPSDHSLEYASFVRSAKWRIR